MRWAVTSGPDRGCVESGNRCVSPVMRMGSVLGKPIAVVYSRAGAESCAAGVSGAVPAWDLPSLVLLGVAGPSQTGIQGRREDVAERAASSSSGASAFFGLLLQQLSAKNKDDSKILNFAATQLTLDSPSPLPSVATSSSSTNRVTFQRESGLPETRIPVEPSPPSPQTPT